MIDLAHCTNDADVYRDIGLDHARFALWNISHLHKPDRLSDIFDQLPDFGDFEKVFLISHNADLLQLRDSLPANCHCWDTVLYDEPVPRYHTYLFWAQFVSTLNRDTGAIDRLTNPMLQEPAPRFLFDCLLGAQRPHRDFIADCVAGSSFSDQIIFNYQPRSAFWLPGSDVDSQDSIDISANSHDPVGKIVTPDSIPNSAVWARYSAAPARALLSLFIPWKLYNDSWYTIVADTDPDAIWPRSCPEINEKIIKPLVAKRLFVYFGAAHSLKRLQQFGFRTFANVIDESYDLCVDSVQRWTLAWQQVQWLAAQDPGRIYQVMIPVLEHNQRLMLDHDWRQDFLTDIGCVAGL